MSQYNSKILTFTATLENHSRTYFNGGILCIKALTWLTIVLVAVQVQLWLLSCSVDINIVDYICMYIIILYCCNLCRKRQLKF